MLTSFVSQNQRDWDLQIPFIMMAYRSAVHDSHGFTPNVMMMGRETTLPIDLMYGKPNDPPKKTPNEYVETISETLERVHEMARSQLKISGEKQKRNYDIRGGKGKPSFALGQMVWYYCPIRQKGLSPKLQKKWHGPCQITKKISDLLYEIRTTNTLHKRIQNIVVHCDKLKPYISPNASTLLSTNSQLQNSDQESSGRTRVPSPQETLDTAGYISKSGRTVRKPLWYGIPNPTN
jgi:hypothetical protein